MKLRSKYNNQLILCSRIFAVLSCLVLFRLYFKKSDGVGFPQSIPVVQSQSQEINSVQVNTFYTIPDQAIRNSTSTFGYPRRICNCNSATSQRLNSSTWISTCSNEASDLGSGQRVRSYSLYVNEVEDIPRFVDQFDAVLANTITLFPGWTSRVYTDVPAGNPWACKFICKYEHLYWCDITQIPVLGNMSFMNPRIWRFLPIGDPTVDIFLSRDIDAPVYERERLVVAEWENSKFTFHTIRDNQYHKEVMLAGLWGLKNTNLQTEVGQALRAEIISLAGHNQTKFYDQDLLSSVIYRRYRNEMLAHDSYFCGKHPDKEIRPFPTQRVGIQIVGATYKYQPIPCPVECRPAYGKDWIYC